MPVGLVVLLVWSAAGEGDMRLFAPGDERAIDELAAVVRTDAKERKGQHASDIAKRRANTFLIVAEQRPALGPAGGHVAEHKRAQVVTSTQIVGVDDDVHLTAPGLRIVPLGEPLDRDLALQECCRPGGTGPFLRRPRLASARWRSTVAGLIASS